MLLSYNSYNKETSLTDTLDVYDNSFIDDDDDDDNQDHDDDNGTIKQEKVKGDHCSGEKTLEAFLRSRKRSATWYSDSSSDESSNISTVKAKKRRQTSIWYFIRLMFCYHKKL